MKKGQIPIPYIIALLLGIAVVAILGYWFFVLGGRIPGQVSETWCNTKKNQYCTEWFQAGFPTTMSERPGGGWSSYAPGCTDIGIYAGLDDCKTLLGVEATTTTIFEEE